jgi:nucleoside 2-deoxyribosyltransferase
MTKPATSGRYKLYLAGPSVFRPDAYEFGRELERICDQHGFEGIYPIGDASEMIMDAKDPRGNARKIFQIDMQKLYKADAVIADMSPFRGPGMDGGTAFEMGAAFVLGKPIIGYGMSLTYRDKTEAWIKAIDSNWLPEADPVTGLVYDHNGIAIDDFGGIENLMMDQSIEGYGADFESALVLMRKLFTSREEMARKHSESLNSSLLKDAPHG